MKEKLEKLRESALEIPESRFDEAVYHDSNSRHAYKSTLNRYSACHLISSETETEMTLISRNEQNFEWGNGYQEERYELVTVFKTKAALKAHVLELWDEHIEEVQKSRNNFIDSIDNLQ